MGHTVGKPGDRVGRGQIIAVLQILKLRSGGGLIPCLAPGLPLHPIPETRGGGISRRRPRHRNLLVARNRRQTRSSTRSRLSIRAAVGAFGFVGDVAQPGQDDVGRLFSVVADRGGIVPDPLLSVVEGANARSLADDAGDTLPRSGRAAHGGIEVVVGPVVGSLKVVPQAVPDSCAFFYEFVAAVIDAA